MNKRVEVFHFISMKGFTLVEVVITLTVLGLILLVIFGAFRLGVSAYERGESTKDDLNKRRLISQLLSQQVKSAFPYRIKTEKAEGDYIAFNGTSQSLKFISTLSLKAKRPEGLVYAHYQFKEERFILYEQRVLNRDFFEDEPKEDSGVVLFEGISDIRFEYLRGTDKEKTRNEEWVNEWDAKSEKELPRSLRMTAILKDTKREDSPLTFLVSIPTYKTEEIRTLQPGLRGRVIPPRP